VKDSKISWTNHTFNIVWGCWKKAPRCANCYAEAWAKRCGWDVWGRDKPRRIFQAPYWQQPLDWDAAAAKTGKRTFVFCSSMADIFEVHPTTTAERKKLWPLIERTPHLTWLLLTGEPENIEQAFYDVWEHDYSHGWKIPPNIWFGASAGTQVELEQNWPLLERFGRMWGVSKLFLSLEPLIGPIDSELAIKEQDYGDEEGPRWTRAADWVIVGGESGPAARPCYTEWIHQVVKDCQSECVPVFVKQLGTMPMTDPAAGGRAVLRHRKGADLEEWPTELRVQEVPDAD
jgi:protein gp37